MKRGMAGGAHRGPPALRRQRRTIRIVQILLVLLAAGLFGFAGYSLGLRGASQTSAPDPLEPPRRPPVTQVIVLAILGGGALATAFLLQSGESVRMPTPRRLDDLAGRAESVAVERAEAAARETGAAPEETAS